MAFTSSYKDENLLEASKYLSPEGVRLR